MSEKKLQALADVDAILADVHRDDAAHRLRNFIENYHDEHFERAAIASINDVLIELLISLAQGTKPERSWVFQAVRSLAEHSRELNFNPVLDTDDILDWERETT